MQNLPPAKFDFHSILKINEIFNEIRDLFFGFCFTMFSIRENVHVNRIQNDPYNSKLSKMFKIKPCVETGDICDIV